MSAIMSSRPDAETEESAVKSLRVQILVLVVRTEEDEQAFIVAKRNSGGDNP